MKVGAALVVVLTVASALLAPVPGAAEDGLQPQSDGLHYAPGYYE